jgi:hypothetical protein
MKHFTKCFLVVSFIATLLSCGTSTTRNSSDQTSKTKDAPEVAVCIWDIVSLRELPSESSKWITALSLGERVFSLQETAIDSSVAKPVEFIKIKLLDDKVGWVRSDFVILDAKPAVFIADANYYSRPDLMTKSNNAYSRFDIVAAKEEQNGWVEIKGKRSNGTWVEAGYVRPDNLSYEDVDLAVAKFTTASLATKNEEKKIEALREIASNSDFSGSLFLPFIYETIESLTAVIVEEEEDDYIYSMEVAEQEEVALVE